MKMPTTRGPICAAVPPVAGFTRLSCGLLYYSPGSPTIGIVSVLPDTTVDYVGGGLRIVTNNVGNGADYGTPGGVHRHGDGRTRLPVAPRNSGYLQTNIGNQHDDIVPAIGLQSVASAGQAQMERRGIAGFFTYNAPNLAGGGQPCGPSPGSAIVAIELRASDLAVRGWTDPGGDPRVAFGAAPTTLQLPFYFCLYALNDQNGFKGAATFGSTTACIARAISFVKGPAGGSVRIRVNGVIQSFPGPVNYINLSGAGAGTWDPAAGVWFPSVVRYEFFSAPALGGVLVADLTVPTAWGGDVIGTP